ncbi:hypothetical protein QOT17_002566 [Balamuthia mandrillaris]
MVQTQAKENTAAKHSTVGRYKKETLKGLNVPNDLSELVLLPNGEYIWESRALLVANSFGFTPSDEEDETGELTDKQQEEEEAVHGSVVEEKARGTWTEEDGKVILQGRGCRKVTNATFDSPKEINRQKVVQNNDKWIHKGILDITGWQRRELEEEQQ